MPRAGCGLLGALGVACGSGGAVLPDVRLADRDGGVDAAIDAGPVPPWQWQDVTPALVEPYARIGAAMAYDANTGDVVLFGGTPAVVSANGSDTWLWNGAAWANPATPVAPPRRSGGCMVTFPGGTLLIGGRTPTSQPLADLWTWVGGVWTERVVAGVPLPQNARACAAGAGAVAMVIDEAGATWRFDNTSWTQVASPPSTARVAMAADPVRSRIVAFAVGGVALDEPSFHEWDGSGWTTTPVLTSPLADTALVYDVGRGGVVLLGGRLGTFFSDQLGLWDGTSFTELGVASPGDRRAAAAAAYDADAGEVVVFGGLRYGGSRDDVQGETWTLAAGWVRETQPSYPPAEFTYAIARDLQTTRANLVGRSGTWTWTGNAWSKIAGRPGLSITRSAVFDLARGELLAVGEIVGGQIGTWAFDGSGWVDRATPFAPAASTSVQAVYDSVREVVWLVDEQQPGSLARWDGATWTGVFAAGDVPVARSGPAIAFDRARGQVVMFGGCAATGLRDTWLWDGVAWSPGDPGDTAPPGQSRGNLYFVDELAELVLLGGGGCDVGVTYAEPWIWNGTAWARRAFQPDGVPCCPPSWAHFDSGDQRHVLVGGFQGLDQTFAGTTWAMTMD